MKNDRDFIFLPTHFSIVQNHVFRCVGELWQRLTSKHWMFSIWWHKYRSLLLIEYQEKCLYRLNGLVSLMESTHLLLRATQRVSYVSWITW